VTCGTRHNELASGKGCCSKAMWYGYGGECFCDESAYGEVSDYAKHSACHLACPAHGGPKRPALFDDPRIEGTRIFKDGNAWSCTGLGFTNLMESPAGFGDTPESAFANYIERLQEAKP